MIPEDRDAELRQDDRKHEMDPEDLYCACGNEMGEEQKSIYGCCVECM